MPEVIIVKTLRGESIVVERKCRVCNHPEREKIEKMLLEGKTYEEIEKIYGVSIATLSRHFKKHMPRLMFDQKEIEKLYEEHRVKQIDLQEELLKLISRLEELFRKLEYFDRKLEEGKGKISWHAYVESVAERRQILQQIRETMLTIDSLGKEVKTEKDITELLQMLKSMKQS